MVALDMAKFDRTRPGLRRGRVRQRTFVCRRLVVRSDNPVGIGKRRALVKAGVVALRDVTG